MVYLGVAPGGHGNRFMRLPNNVVFTLAHAIFEETVFPKCEKHGQEDTQDDGPAAPSPPPSPLAEEPELEQPPAPRTSGRQRKKTVGDSETWRDPGKKPRGRPSRPTVPKQVPGPSSAPGNPGSTIPSDTQSAPPEREEEVAQLCREGGVKFINYLLSQAVTEESVNNAYKNIREWHYRDIARLPKAEQEEWKTACREELEALRK
ncbi:hypothetical protein K435DRAFT_607398, partial [Dendrothele bispora CBS 962.96]